MHRTNYKRKWQYLQKLVFRDFGNGVKSIKLLSERDEEKELWYEHSFKAMAYPDWSDWE